MTHRSLCPLRARRAMTTVELIMAMAVGVVLFGVVLGVLLQTQRASDRVIVHEQMMQEALVIEHKLGSLLRQAVPDGRLAADGLPESRLGADFMEFYAAGERLDRWIVRAEAAGRGEGAPIHVSARRTGVQDGELGPTGAALPLGLGLEKFNSAIAFQYAEEFDGLEPRWAGSAGTALRVVRYTITISDRHDRAAPVVVSSSVRWPGL